MKDMNDHSVVFPTTQIVLELAWFRAAEHFNVSPSFYTITRKPAVLNFVVYTYGVLVPIDYICDRSPVLQMYLLAEGFVFFWGC
jgi:hypothetical protein